MRGKLQDLIENYCLRRITPAGAGKTSITQVSSSSARDHPRRCGENHYPRVRAVLMGGSPPQVRGKPVTRNYREAVVGITPAGAGKTEEATAFTIDKEDHPRRCGENPSATASATSTPGSPPQVRGKHKPREYTKTGDRITPAGAGKTGTVGVCAVGIEDHPRRCGENASV